MSWIRCIIVSTYPFSLLTSCLERPGPGVQWEAYVSNSRPFQVFQFMMAALGTPEKPYLLKIAFPML